MANKHPVEIDGITGEVETLPRQQGARYRCKLDTMNDVKREMAKVYRESRSEVIDPSTGSKLAIHSPKSGEKCKKEALFGVI